MSPNATRVGMKDVLVMGRGNCDFFTRRRNNDTGNQHTYNDPAYNPLEMEHYTTAGTTFGAGFIDIYLKYASATGVVINPE